MKTARKTINKPVVNRKSPNVSSANECHKIHSAPGREKLNTRDRGKMCWAGPRWRPNRRIAYGTVIRTCTVQYGTRIVPSSNTTILEQ